MVFLWLSLVCLLLFYFFVVVIQQCCLVVFCIISLYHLGLGGNDLFGLIAEFGFPHFCDPVSNKLACIQ